MSYNIDSFKNNEHNVYLYLQHYLEIDKENQFWSSVITYTRRYGEHGIFNPDHGSQYTSHEDEQLLNHHDIQILMNGKGHSPNITIECFFKTLKYDEIHNRFHAALGYQKPMNVYLNGVRKVA